MSDIKDKKATVRIYGGLIIDIAEKGFERAQKILAGVPGGAKQAVGHALARAGRSGATEGKRAVVKEYTIGGGNFMRYTHNINHFRGLEVVFGYRGTVIPLTKFTTKATNTGMMVNVRKDTGMQEIDHAFYASIRGHNGVFMREGTKRLPIHELFGPATPSMMYSNETVMDQVEQKVVDTFEKRIDHEISRILNGW